ncbi:MAG: 4-(cytidine 5'-diphospho)-2-C-methyl-D-erythritol kinase [Bacteroidales bacterium]|nr:4-(cytidine 5'-diphospho)-2-C-methyl-D-erythritol kinase [Bacteroidales bacterium]
MTLQTNVKVNLGLNVLRKREDGFHDIETLFLPCHEYSDVLEVITGDDYSRTSASMFARYSEEQLAQGISQDGKLMITIARKEGVDWAAEKDLCARAYSLLDKDFDLPPVKIFLEKKAPVGAGLGGGSADAAFTLRSLNELFSLALSDEALAGYASRLGSDCAFFIFNTPMLGSGRGEVLESVDFDLERLGLQMKVLVPEGISVSTAQAYRGIVPKEPEMRIRDIISLPPERWKDLLVNDFEQTVFSEHKELAAIRQSLYDSGAVYASMSGSGSALFGLYRY